MKNAYPRTNGFTLIELLVVISIIALLIGILLPALGAARGVAQISASASNQRQIGIAMAAYAGANGGYFPLWQRASGGPPASDPLTSGAIQWYWTTKLAADSYIQALEIYADPSWDAPTPFLDDAVQTGNTDYNLDDRRFNRIHYGYNYVHIGANYHQESTTTGGIRSGGSVKASNPRANASSFVPARLEDMQDPSGVLITTGARDFLLNGSDPAFDDGTRPTEATGPWGAHVVFDYPQLQNSTGNGGNPHARYNDNVQIMWGDGHVSQVEMPFTEEEQEADPSIVFDEDALGTPASLGSSGGGRGSVGSSNDGAGNYFDIVRTRPNN